MWSLSDDDVDSAAEEQLPVESEDELCPKGSVPLHQLCDWCRRMFDTFADVYTWFEGSPRKFGIKPRKLESCTLLSDLVKNLESCHFCAITYSMLRDKDNLPPDCSVAFRVDEETFKRKFALINVYFDGNRHCFNVMIEFFLCECHSAFQLHFNDIANLSLRCSDNIFKAPFGARYISREPVDNLIQIQKWLDTCTSKHVECNDWCSRLETKGLRPTRVLELNDTGIRLRCNPNDIYNFKYLALSHMWGKDPAKQLRLVSSTLQDFQMGIPLDTLPHIFTEAIRITRYLGFKYLWIDSLCIIQDSKSDWTAEANMMSAVYNNAICTIAFVLPPDVSYTSAQCRGDPRASTPCIIREPTRAGRGIVVRPWFYKRIAEEVHRGWPLSSRAWTLQEQVLSPRTVFWGDRTIKWECVETFCDELTGELAVQSRGHSDSLSNKVLLSKERIWEPNETSSTDSTLSQIENDGIPYETLSNWAALVNRYRRRDLTQASDRIMAFAGIAQAFQAEHGLTYLAGMWKEHLPRSLMWHIYDPANRPGIISSIPESPVLESVPTWSFFASPVYSSRLDRSIELRHNWDDWDYYFEQNLFSATFLHFTWSNNPVNRNPPTAYYDFAGLRITLKFLTVDVPLPRDQELDHGVLPCESLEAQLCPLFRLNGNPKSISVGFFFDDYGKFDQAPTEVRIALVEESWNKSKGFYYSEGLVLAPGAEENTWKRLGYMYGTAGSGDRHHSLWDMMIAEKAPREDSTSESREESIFLRLEGARIETLTLV